MSEALTKAEDPRAYLAETKFKGIFGPYSFDENGDVVGLSLVLKQNRNGIPKILR